MTKRLQEVKDIAERKKARKKSLIKANRKKRRIGRGDKKKEREGEEEREGREETRGGG